MNKKLRQKVYEKYNGKCGYTGTELKDDWQVDHIHPKCLNIQSNHDITHYDDINNLIPCNRIVNHYKRSFDLEGFRKYMLVFHLRLAKLPKNTNSPSTIKRKEYMNKVAYLFDITIDTPFSGVFYFETLK